VRGRFATAQQLQQMGIMALRLKVKAGESG
jgi:hypothetical protein